MNIKKIISNIRNGLKCYIEDYNIQSLVIGISGGMDSCLCAALAKPVCDELNIPLIGVGLPSKSNKKDERDRANLTGKIFCTKYSEDQWVQNSIILMPKLQEVTTNELKSEFDDKAWKIRLGNIKARLRMIYLYNLASLNKGLVLSTDNYTEYLLGFWTLHGDVGDYGMIQELWKTEVYDIAEWIMENECTYLDQKAVIEQSINALATDGLGVTNTGDLGQILSDWSGTSRNGYKEVDRILQVWLSLDDIGEKQRMTIYEKLYSHPVIQRHFKTHFKRNNPFNLKRNIIIE